MEPRQHRSWIWILCMLGACGILVWNTTRKIDHVDYLSAVGMEGENYAAGGSGVGHNSTELSPNNALPIPDQLTESYHWLAQTERMLNRGEAHVRHIDYENAPFGRAVRTPSPYRWWLGALAWCEHLVTGSPASLLVEKAALWADPLLLTVLFIGSAILTGKYFGWFAASVASLGFVSFYPFVSGFLPGAPDDRGLAEILAIGSVLLILVGSTNSPESEATRRRWYIMAGIAGGLGLWVKVPVQLPVLLGLFLGGGFAAMLGPRGDLQKNGTAALPWRAWSYAGAATTIAASLIEYTPGELRTCDLSFIHPLHGLAWLGAGALLATVSEWRRAKVLRASARAIVVIAASLAAVVAVPVLLVMRYGRELFVIDSMGSHLTRHRDGVVAANLAIWLGAQGPSVWLLLTFAPLGALFLAGWLLLEKQTARPTRIALAIALGPVLVALAIACAKLRWWQTADGLLLLLLVAAAPAVLSQQFSARVRLRWAILALLVVAPGLVYAVGWDRPSKGNALNQTEVQDLILRDLGRWIAQHSEAGAAIVLSPPSASTALCYYGNFRGIGALSEDNKEGIAAVIRIMSSRSVSETKEVLNRRKITHVVLLSWDSFFDECARAGSGQVEGTFRDRLGFASLPAWLRPLAYQSPSIPGFEDQAVTVFEVVEDQDEATALSNIALYFVDIGNLDQARAAAAGLSQFPIDVGAWVARAQVAAAIGDDAELAKALKVIQSRLAARVQPLISWDRRVDLAVVLARAKLETLAKKQLELCINSLDDTKLRSLSPLSVYRLLIMCRGLNIEMPAHERALAVSLVPSGLRGKFE